MTDGSYALPVHSGGNRAGITPASLVTLYWAPVTVNPIPRGHRIEKAI